MIFYELLIKTVIANTLKRFFITSKISVAIYIYICRCIAVITSLTENKQRLNAFPSPRSNSNECIQRYILTYILYIYIYKHIYIIFSWKTYVPILCVCTCYKRVSYIDLNGSPGHAKYPPPGPAILPLEG